ncbi:MAG TPA: hypothetical protein VFX44_09840 [Solirubrobacterales bacterium]|nr:hypothetical protein [Solirubrobacterales bacterium]
MPSDDNPFIEEKLVEEEERLGRSRASVRQVDTAIEKKENEIKTAEGIASRQISNAEKRLQEAQINGRGPEANQISKQISQLRNEHAKGINQLESELGKLRNERIEAAAILAAAEESLGSLKEKFREQAERASISDEQVRRAANLEKRLERLEQERGDLVARIEEYAPLVEAQREATAGSGSAELSQAYAEQANDYRSEWKRWLKALCVATVVALAAGIGVILLVHPSSSASNGTIVSRIAIEVLVLGLLVYAVRVTAHQFRVHRHLETVCRNKASALRTFSRLVAGPGEAEVRTAVAVALAQAVFDSNFTGFIDSSQDGVTIVERFAAPVAQRLSGN